MDFVESCRQFIAIDSSPGHGTREIAETAARLCREKGLEVELHEEFHQGVSEVNLIARWGKSRPAAELMLQTHLDTVDPGPFQLWAQNGHNPFDAHIIDGRIYGLGAADVKLDFLCKLEAMAGFKGRTSWKLPPVLLGTYGEELGMAGAMKVIRKNLVSAKMALIGEPSDLNMIRAGKGFARVEIRLPFSDEEKSFRASHDLDESTSTQSRMFHGKPGHSSSPESGDSAIKKMLDYFMQLPNGIAIMEIDGGINHNSVPAHAFLEIETTTLKQGIAQKIRDVYREILALEEDFRNHRDPEFSPEFPTLNMGLIRTNEDHVLMGGCCRIPPSISHTVYEGWMKRLHDVCAKWNGQFQVTDYKKPFRTADQSILVKGCQDELRALGLPDRPVTQSSTNEASLFSRVGVDCVCFGPGVREGNVHTPTEHVKIEDLNKAIAFYRKVIERFCL